MKNTKKPFVLLVSLLLIICVTVVGTVALLTTKDGALTNLFKPSKVTTRVDETLDNDNKVKSDVKITNTGDTEAYIRAAVIITWQDEAGNVYGKMPVKDTDYTIVYGIDDFSQRNNWVYAADGFWYHTVPVAAGASTDILIDECTVGTTTTDVILPAEGYNLNVEIIASGIQSKPTHVVTTEWASGVAGVSDNGTLDIKLK